MLPATEVITQLIWTPSNPAGVRADEVGSVAGHDLADRCGIELPWWLVGQLAEVADVEVRSDGGEQHGGFAAGVEHGNGGPSPH
jgi:hypothetical protein